MLKSIKFQSPKFERQKKKIKGINEWNMKPAFKSRYLVLSSPTLYGKMMAVFKWCRKFIYDKLVFVVSPRYQLLFSRMIFCTSSVLRPVIIARFSMEKPF